DRLPAEEAVPRDRKGGERAQDQGDAGRGDSDLDRGEEGAAGGVIVEGLAEPLRRDAVERPLQRGASVEGVDRDDQQRDVDEGERDPDADAQEVSVLGGESHRTRGARRPRGGERSAGSRPSPRSARSRTRRPGAGCRYGWGRRDWRCNRGSWG